MVKWFPDASVDYGKGKHIGLLIVGTIILVFGLPYTTLIFAWQWLVRCYKFKIFRNLKFRLFIDTYHTPHTAKHRYWTGVLLFVRVIIFLISTFSVSTDPRIALLSTLVIVSCLQLYKTVFVIRVYKNYLLNAIESFVLFNIAILTAVMWYTFDNQCNKKMEILQTTTSYVSVGTIAVLCLLVIYFHVYRYERTKIYSLGKNTKLGKFLQHQILHHQYPEPRTSADRESDVYQLFDISYSYEESTSSYCPPPVRPHEEPTCSTVSLADCEELCSS